MIGRQVSLRLPQDLDEFLQKFMDQRQYPQLLRALVILAAEGLRKDPSMLSDLLIGATRKEEYEIRVLRKVDSAELEDSI